MIAIIEMITGILKRQLSLKIYSRHALPLTDIENGVFNPMGSPGFILESVSIKSFENK